MWCKGRKNIAVKWHAYGEAVVTKEATETEEGIKTSTCTVCGDTKEEVISYITAEAETPLDDTTKNDTVITDADTDTDTDADNNDKPNNMTRIIIAIGAVVLIGGGVTAVILIRKKK